MEKQKPKIGAEHAAAWARLGLSELRNLAFFSGSNVAAPPEPGLYGTKTPGEVAKDRGAKLQQGASDLVPTLLERLTREEIGEPGSPTPEPDEPEIG